MIQGVWLIFTETYTTILGAAMIGPSVDDAFFGYNSLAKVCHGLYALPCFVHIFCTACWTDSAHVLCACS